MEKNEEINLCHLKQTPGFVNRKLLYPTWEKIFEVNMPQPICNLYRKISMGLVGKYRLFAVNLKTNDPFIIKELIENRI